MIAALATGKWGSDGGHLGLWEGAGVDSEAARLRRGEPDALVALLEEYAAPAVSVSVADRAPAGDG